MNQPPQNQPPHGGQYPAQGGGQYPPQGGHFQAPAGYELKKKRKKWPWIVGGLLLLFIIAGVSGNSGKAGPTAQPGQAPAPGAAQGAGKQADGAITYEVVSGSGKGSASVTYTSGKNFNQAQENGARLPWTKSVDLGGSSLFNGATLVAQAGSGVNSITCRIKDGNEVLTENTSTGQFAVVTCSGT